MGEVERLRGIVGAPWGIEEVPWGSFENHVGSCSSGNVGSCREKGLYETHGEKVGENYGVW